MDDGIYESLLTRALIGQLRAGGLEERADIVALAEAEQPHVLARHIADLVDRRLRSVRDPGERLRIANDVVGLLQESTEAVESPARRLLAVRGTGLNDQSPVRPATPLTEAALLTNSPHEPALAAELRHEIATAERIDLLCAFVRWHGLRLLDEPLRAARERGAQFRVITTTYLGSTERAALDRMVNEFGAQVRVQYDAQRTRLHAKAWLFRRTTGFDTAYVGSSNLSRAALLDGVE